MIPGTRRRRGTRDLPVDGWCLTAGAAALLAVGALAGCGGSSGASASTGDPGTGGARSGSSSHRHRHVHGLKVAADPRGILHYRPDVLRTRSKNVTINFVNHSPLDHNLTLANSRGVVLGATPTFQGGTRTLTLKLKPGRYTFYCTVPGHRTGGMQGTLIVR